MRNQTYGARSFSCMSLAGSFEPEVRGVHLQLITKVRKDPSFTFE